MLDVFFRPRTVAVIGASNTPGKVGHAVFQNLTSFKGQVFPVNQIHSQILGRQTWRRISDIPVQVDLAVIATPAVTVPEIIQECVKVRVRGAIIISSGFREIGPKGVELEREIRILSQGKIRIVGPNCLGIMSPYANLNATFANTIAQPGGVAFISQSGALCTAILDWSLREKVGFSAFVSIGSMLDVGWGDLIQYLNDDPQTQSIIIYMESVGDARTFLSATRETALKKPVIVLKPGRSVGAAKAAASHTGALTGSDEVLDAAFRRCGALRVDSIAELFEISEVLAKQPRPNGSRLTIVTNAGGPAVLAADSIVSSGGKLAELSPETINALNDVLPPHWSHGNPIDIIGDADADRYAKAIEIAKKDPESDGLLVILTPQGMTDPTLVADKIRPFAHIDGRPILASWMGGAAVATGEDILRSAGIPTFSYPDAAARAFQAMWRYSDNLKELYETPIAVDDRRSPDCRTCVEEIVRRARIRNRTLLTELESKKVLTAYGIPTVETHIATSEDEAVAIADKLGYPVVLKLHSETVTHKTDVDGVKLDIVNQQAARTAFRAIRESVIAKVGREHFLGITVQSMIKRDGHEIILGSSVDREFGPVLLFGAGGRLVELFRDRALGLPPLNTTLARRMMERTKIYRALQGFRGQKSVDLVALEQLLVRFSRLVVEQPWIREIDINPLLVSSEQSIALDARILLHGSEMTEKDLPKLAIRPYPSQYVRPWQLRDGSKIFIRPISPEDEPLMIDFHRQLSDRSVYFRYFHMLALTRRIEHDRLTRICFIDYDREIALVAERNDPGSGKKEIIAVGRLTKLHGVNSAEIAVLVCDAFHRRGIGRELLRRLLDIARDEKLDVVEGQIVPENGAMIRICRNLGFDIKPVLDEGTVYVRLSLSSCS